MNSLYNRGEDVEVQRTPSDALLVIDSADRGTSSASPGFNPNAIPQLQPYNQFRIQKPENLIQGGFNRLSLVEINFPYAIPNLTPTTNNFWVKLQNPASGTGTAQIFAFNSATKFSNGTDLAENLTTTMNADPNIGISSPSAVEWLVEYLPDEFGGFVIQASAPTTLTTAKGKNFKTRVGIPQYNFGLYPVNPALLTIPASGIPSASSVSIPKKNLLTIMGYDYVSSWASVTGYEDNRVSYYATLSYTQYIDVISSKLTQYQKVKDGSGRVASQNNVVCRIFIADENSQTTQVGVYFDTETNSPISYSISSPPGALPFNIHRQFQNPKQFRWNDGTSVDWIDITLLDDTGAPLFVPQDSKLVGTTLFEYDTAMPNFQITFKCSED